MSSARGQCAVEVAKLASDSGGTDCIGEEWTAFWT